MEKEKQPRRHLPGRLSYTTPNPDEDEAHGTWISLVWTGWGLAVLCTREGKAGAGLVLRLSPRPHRRLGRHARPWQGPGRPQPQWTCCTHVLSVTESRARWPTAAPGS